MDKTLKDGQCSLENQLNETIDKSTEIRRTHCMQLMYM